MPDDVESRERRHRLELRDAMLAALERRDEVLAVIADAEDAEAALARVRELLDMSEWAAYAVLNLQWRRLTRTERARIERERDSLARHLAQRSLPAAAKGGPPSERESSARQTACPAALRGGGDRHLHERAEARLDP